MYHTTKLGKLLHLVKQKAYIFRTQAPIRVQRNALGLPAQQTPLIESLFKIFLLVSKEKVEIIGVWKGKNISFYIRLRGDQIWQNSSL
jgi:hypothetical protein